MASVGLAACGGGGGGAGTVPDPTTVSNITLATPRYSQSLLITVDGTGLDALPTVSSPACLNMARSTSAPNISTPTRAYYTCTVSSTGASSVGVSFNGSLLRSQAYSVPEPQVTLTLSSGGTGTVNGEVVLTLDPTRVPITVNNFLRYVNDGFYDGTIFHRVVADFVAQGGGFLPLIPGLPAEAKTGLHAPIVLEVGRGLSNIALTVAMARTGASDSATAQFYINLVNNSADLDPGPFTAGYAVFGAVTSGAGIVTALGAAPCTRVIGLSECAPNPNVVMVQVRQTR